MSNPISLPIKLYQSLFILRKNWGVINRAMNRLRTNHGEKITVKPLDDVDAVDTFSIILLETNTFLEEYNKQFHHVEPTHRHRVNDVRTIAKPVLLKIGQWRDIHRFRSQIIAHNWRDKQHNFKIPDLNEYVVPRNKFEYQVLSDLINYVMTIINSEFETEVKEMYHYFQSITPPKKPAADYSGLNQELEEIHNHVSKSCKDSNKNYPLNLTLYDIDKPA